MKVWIDVLTPKQVLFYEPLAEEFRRRDFEVFTTSRRYRELEFLAENLGLDLDYVGRHGGSKLGEKVRVSGERVAELSQRIPSDIDAAVSFSSPECARVAFGLGIPHFAINDSPHSESVARLTIPLSKILFTPWLIPSSAWTRFGIDAKQVIHYHALDPYVWIKYRRRRNAFHEEVKLDKARKTIVIRLEERRAAYLLDSSPNWANKILDALSSSVEHCNIVVLCRYEDQLREVSDRYGSRFIVPQGAVDGLNLLERTDVFIGMGGTMTAEAVLLGVPTISAYPKSFLIESFLLKRGLIMKPKSAEALVKLTSSLVDDEKLRTRLREKSKRLLREMKDPTVEIVSATQKFVQHKT